MSVEKIKYLKESIMTDTLKNKLLNLIIKIKEYENLHKNELNLEYQTSYDFQVLINEIFNYFYELSSSIFDNFVCEGGSEEYSYKSFKLFYINIYYSFLKEFFVENPDIKRFFSKINKNQYQKIYATCEDSLFNFIAYYFFSSNSEHKTKIEHILKNIIHFDCDTPDKEKRYKRILFMHYKESVCNEILSYMNKIKDKMREIHKEIASIRIIVKILKTRYYDFNKEYGIKKLIKKHNPVFPTYIYPINSSYADNSLISRESLWDNVKFFKNKIKNKNKEYSDLEKIYHVQDAKYSHVFNLTQEKFENDK